MHIVHHHVSDSYSFCKICSLQQVSKEALRLRLRDGRWGSEAPAPLTWRGISSHENWDWGLRPRVSHQTSPGEWSVIRISWATRKLWCETRGEMQTVLWENVRKGLNKQLWKVHCTVRRSEIAESQTCDNFFDRWISSGLFWFLSIWKSNENRRMPKQAKRILLSFLQFLDKILSSRTLRIESGESQILSHLWRRYTQTYANFFSSI